MPKTPILRGLERSAHLVDRALAPALAQLSFGSVEAHVLIVLAHVETTPAADLRRALGLRPTTFTSVIDRLEARGLLRRVAHPGDRRSFDIRLTASGKRSQQRVAGVLEALEGRIRGQVSEGDLAGFSRVLAALDSVANGDR